jgi:hypothetical protein
MAAVVVAHEPQPGLADKTAKLLKQIEGMSEHEVQGSLDHGHKVMLHAGA